MGLGRLPRHSRAQGGRRSARAARAPDEPHVAPPPLHALYAPRLLSQHQARFGFGFFHVRSAQTRRGTLRDGEGQSGSGAPPVNSARFQARVGAVPGVRAHDEEFYTNGDGR